MHFAFSYGNIFGFFSKYTRINLLVTTYAPRKIHEPLGCSLCCNALSIMSAVASKDSCSISSDVWWCFRITPYSNCKLNMFVEDRNTITPVSKSVWPRDTEIFLSFLSEKKTLPLFFPSWGNTFFECSGSSSMQAGNRSEWIVSISWAIIIHS